MPANSNHRELSGYQPGFTWGFKSTATAGDSMGRSRGQQQQQEKKLRVENSENRYKRRASEDEAGSLPPTAVSFSPAKRSNGTKRKSHLCSNIRGQSLPIQRGLELMDKEQLQMMLVKVMEVHPEAQQTVHSKLADADISIDKCKELLKGKMENIFHNTPYNRSEQMTSLNDYAFVRMKPYILEFLNCLIDCILDNIPPRAKNLYDSWKFLDNCTSMILQLPRFQMPSNNYYYDKCLEQLSYVWCTLIEHIANDVAMLCNNNVQLCEWMDRLSYLNKITNGVLDRPLQLFKSLNIVHYPSTLPTSSFSASTDFITISNNTNTTTTTSSSSSTAPFSITTSSDSNSTNNAIVHE